MYGFQGDGLVTEHYAGWAQTPAFKAARKAGYDTIRSRRPDINVDWRLQVCLWAAKECMRRPGHFLECGVHTGIYSRAILEYLGEEWRQSGKTMWLLDTFTGIPVDQLSDRERQNERMNRKYDGDIYQEVSNTFSQFENVKLIQGKVPETLYKIDGIGWGRVPKLAYVSIDMNCAYPEVEACKWAWPRMVPGAIMVLDDYGFRAHKAQREALDAWAADMGIGILALPTGQGLVVR